MAEVVKGWWDRQASSLRLSCLQSGPDLRHDGLGPLVAGSSKHHNKPAANQHVGDEEEEHLFNGEDATQRKPCGLCGVEGPCATADGQEIDEPQIDRGYRNRRDEQATVGVENVCPVGKLAHDGDQGPGQDQRQIRPL